MANQKEIDKYKEEFKKSSDDDLINAKHSWVPTCAQHIAAVQEIESRRRNISKNTNLITKLIFVLTIILLILALIEMVKPDIVPTEFPNAGNNTKTTNDNSNTTN
ncbi:hypothetical protein ES702_03466 [subsurface metagenome]